MESQSFSLQHSTIFQSATAEVLSGRSAFWRPSRWTAAKQWSRKAIVPWFWPTDGSGDVRWVASRPTGYGPIIGWDMEIWQWLNELWFLMFMDVYGCLREAMITSMDWFSRENVHRRAPRFMGKMHEHRWFPVQIFPRKPIQWIWLWLRSLGTIGTKNSWLMDGNSLNYGNNRFYPSPYDGNKDPGTSEILG